MVASTVIIASDSTQGAPFDIRAISQAFAPALAVHGEEALIAGLAHAIGVRRIVEAATGAPRAFFCAPVVATPPHAPQIADAPAADGQQTIVTYYIAGCEGAKRLARRLGRRIFKIGCTCKEIPAQRLDGLDLAVYGGWAANQSFLNAKKPRAGWSDWNFARHEPVDTAHLCLPDAIKIENGLWRVRLPAGVSWEEFDRIVTAAMKSRELGFWAMSGEGKTHCRQKGLDPQEFVRFSRDDRTGVLRPVEELYTFSIRRDASWFATILIQALAKASQRG